MWALVNGGGRGRAALSQGALGDATMKENKEGGEGEFSHKSESHPGKRGCRELQGSTLGTWLSSTVQCATPL